MITKAEGGAVPPRQAKECLELPETGHGRKDWSVALVTPSFQASGFQDCERINFCCLEPLNLWLFIMSLLGVDMNALSQGCLFSGNEKKVQAIDSILELELSVRRSTRSQFRAEHTRLEFFTRIPSVEK